jgi:elongation factor G
MSDRAGGTYALNLSSEAAVQLCVMLSRHPPAQLALEALVRGGRFRLDDFVPIIEVEIAPEDAAGRAELAAALASLAAEDTQIRFENNAGSGTVKLAGIDERQLDEKISALRAIYKAQLDIGPPQIAYRERIIGRAEVDYRHKRQIGGTGEFARVRLVLEPLPSREGISFIGIRVRDILNDDYIAAVERGVRAALASGPAAGFPVIGVRALLVDAALHPTDSSALAFEIAARAATLEALQIGEPVMLEPIMRLDIVTPEEHVDSIVEDLKARRGHTDGRGRRSPDGIVIVASVPAANLFGYAAALLSMAGERACFLPQFESYAPVPGPQDPAFRPAVGLRV